MAEWLKAHAWKACVGQLTVGSNPTLSANFHFCPKRQERACRQATHNAIFALRATKKNVALVSSSQFTSNNKETP